MTRIAFIKKLLHVLVMVLERFSPRVQRFFGMTGDTPWVREFDKIFNASFRLWEGGAIPLLEAQNLRRTLRLRWASCEPHDRYNWPDLLSLYRQRLYLTPEWTKLEHMYVLWRAEQRRMAMDII